MSDITVKEETELTIKLLYKLCEIIMHRLEIDRGERELSEGDTLEAFDGTIQGAARSLSNRLMELENEFGGGYIDVGASRTLRQLGEGDVNQFNMIFLFQNYQAVLNKFVLMDVAQSSQEELGKFSAICSEFSGKRRVA